MTLIERIDAYLDLHAMEATRFGTLATNDSHLVFDIRNGRKLRRVTVRKIEAFMAMNITNPSTT